MKENFVTVFDSLFLPNGIALHTSMERTISNYILWIICVDDQTYEALTELALPNTRLLFLKLIETPKLCEIKLTRTKGEYCWTLTPFAPRFVFEADKSVNRVTYIDADLWFLSSPAAIFLELEKSGKSVLITDHAYAPEYDQSRSSGQFCVQFMTFMRLEGESVRKWWEDRCIEWCFNRFEDGKFGDQRYLDKWPQQFPNIVHILQDKELALAPWNASRFPLGNAVFYHFHGLRITSKNTVNTGEYTLPRTVLKYVYEPYLKDLKKSIETLSSIGIELKPQAKPLGVIRKIHISFSKIYNIIISLLCYELKINRSKD
jgi:hypothetical protein